MVIPRAALREALEGSGLGEFLMQITNMVPIPLGLLCLIVVGFGIPGYEIFKISKFYYAPRDRKPSSIEYYIDTYSKSWIAIIVGIPIVLGAIKGSMYMEEIYEPFITLAAIIWIPAIIILSWWEVFIDQRTPEEYAEKILKEAILDNVRKDPDSEASETILKALEMREQQKRKTGKHQMK